MCRNSTRGLGISTTGPSADNQAGFEIGRFLNRLGVLVSQSFVHVWPSGF